MSQEDLLLSSYQFELPQHLIAQRPLEKRDACKLLIYHAKADEIIHTTFDELPKYLNSSDRIVMNRTKVFPARLHGQKPTGGKAEVFILKLIPETLNGKDAYQCFIKASRKRKEGETFLLEGALVTIEKLDGKNVYVSFEFESHESLEQYLYDKGSIPIPPYIRQGQSDQQDRTDYQTVYAKEVGSVAAPTAGLHFTDELFKRLESQGVEKSTVTLHVGAGTFAPVKSENILEHDMHTESYFYDSENLEKIKASQGNIIAVGTTSLRALESSVDENGKWVAVEDQIYDTNIFLYPGKKVHTPRGLITNFHLPGSTLIMLVSTLVGRKKTLELYEQAIKNDYRFYSYGDAMLILLR